MESIKILREKLLREIDEANTLDLIDKLRISIFGKHGHVSMLMKGLSNYSYDERKERGSILNSLRNELLEIVNLKKETLEAKKLEDSLRKEKIDVTLNTRPNVMGKIHPLSQTMYEIISIFSKQGFSVAEGPDIEDDFHNFTALNFPKNHPAREEQDTFYLPEDSNGDRKILRTHTSPVQIRSMMKNKPPICIIAPGKTYRSDSDITHTPTFHQVEGLLIGEDVNMRHLKGCIIDFCDSFFEIKGLPIIFRPGFFPFVEPGAEVEIGCDHSKGELKIGGTKQWLEILGCGMIHPNVLLNCGLDPQKHQGFAFGMGVERLAMLKYGIPDLRSFYESDFRWLDHYGFNIFEAFSRRVLQ